MNPRTGHNLSWTPEDPLVIQHAVSSPSSSIQPHNSSTDVEEGEDRGVLMGHTDVLCGAGTVEEEDSDVSKRYSL